MVKVQVKPYNTVGNLEKTLGATDLNDNEETTELTLRQLLRPSLISMAISGCYIYDPEFVRTGGETSRGRFYRIFGWFYRMFYFTVCLAGLVQAVVAFFTIPPDFIQLNAPKVIFYAQCVCFCLIAWKSNHAKHGGQLKAFAFWDCKISPQMKAIGLKPPYEKLKKRQRIYLANAFLLWCLSTGGAVLLSADIFSDSYSSFVSAPFTSSILSLSISVLIQGVVSLTWIISIFYLLTLSTLMTSSFEILNTYFEKEQDSAVIISKFQNLRMLHLNLTKMVTALDKDFGYYLASIFLFSGGIACFILYQILRVQLDGISLLAFTSTLMSVAGLICLASVFAAFVNESVSSSFYFIWNLSYDVKRQSQQWSGFYFDKFIHIFSGYCMEIGYGYFI